VRRFQISPALYFVVAGFLALLTFAIVATISERRGADYAPLVLGILFAWLGICRVRQVKRKFGMWPRKIKF
jgi:hypothetical protein